VKRREFIAGLAGTAAWPLAAQAQQAMPVVGFLSPGPPSQVDAIDAFRQGLSEAGFVEGQNVTLELRFAEGHFDRLPELAADLVRRKVNVIIALGVAASVGSGANVVGNGCGAIPVT
jgi:putative ABC transport system substrate-binding protein